MGVCCIAYQPRSGKGRAKPLNKATLLGAAATCAITILLTCSPAAAQSADINILFVGNSFTHGRYDPALNYNAGAANSPGDSLVHDLLCPSLTASGACTSGAGAVAPVIPTSANTPGGTLQGQLNYLQANPSAQYTEPGPFGGVAGVFLQFTKEAGLHYNVSLVAVSSATLTGYLNNTGSEAGDLPLIANSKWNQVVLSDQSFRPLPTTVTVNGTSVPTRGSPSGFQSGVNGLVNAIDTADGTAGKSNAAVTLYETQPLASYGYTSTNPNAPIFGSSTPAQQGGNPAYAPYVGAANPIAQMASDLHNAYTGEATSYNSANPNGSRVGVALAGDAWVSAINLGIAVQNPYLTNNPASKVDLWDSNPLTACCTTPIGYHPSAYGAYLNAMSIFYKITGIDPTTLDAEANPNNPLFLQSAANALGISANDAQLLAIAAADTVRAGGPVSNFELQTGTIYAVLTGGAGLIKDGPGTVILTASNTYTGATTVSGGTLEVDGSIASSSLVTVNAGGILSGTGIVDPAVTTIMSGGVLAPGNPSNPTGTLTITGNLAFQSGAFYLVQVNGGAAGSVSVTGGATLAGAAVDAVFGGSANLVRQYTILTAAGGVSGTFAPSVVNTNLAPGLSDTLSYDANNVYLNLTASLGAGQGLNANQQNVATSINKFFNSGGALPTAFAGLFGLPGLANALTQASGELGTGSQQTTFDAMGAFMSLLTDPFMGRGNGFGGATAPAAYTGESDQASAYAAPRRSDAFAMFTKAPPVPFVQKWSVWAAGYGGTQSTDGNAALGSNSATSRIAGTAVGADYLFSPDTLAGFALAGGGTNFSVNNLGSGRSDLFQAGAYVRHTNGAAYVTGALAYGWQDITTDRNVTIAGLDHLRAEFNANTYSGRIEGGYRFVAPVLGGVGITPYAAGQFVTFDLPAYAETVVSGAPNFALNYGAQSVTDSRSELGIRTDRSFAVQNGILTVRSRFAWAHDFDPDRSVAATFQTLPGASFVVGGASQASDSALTTGSVEMKWKNGWSAAATFEGEFSKVTQSYAGKGVVRYIW
jgi:autotransporter-associated beta strand protein